MHAIRLPTQLRRPLGAGPQPSVPPESTAAALARRFGRLDARDHRDDGSMIGGLLIGLCVGILAWALVIILLVVLW